MNNNPTLPTPVDGEMGETAAIAPKKKSPLVPLIRGMQRKALLILACVGATTTVAWLLSADDPPTYGGSFQMLVEPVTSEARVAAPAALTRGDSSPNDFSLDYPTQLELLQSPRVLGPVFEAVRVKYPDFTYIELRSNLLVERTGGKNRLNQTKILQVSYRGYDPELVQFVLEQLARQYLTYSLEDRRTRIGQGVKFIEDQLPDLKKRVNQLQGQIEKIQQEYDLVNPESQGAEVFGQLRAIAEQQRANEREIMEQQTLFQTLQQQLQLSPNEALAASALSQDTRYQQLLNSISQLEAQIATESARFSEASPVIQRLRERQANLVGVLNREAQRILGQTLGNVDRNPLSLTFQDSVRVGLIQQMVNTRNQLAVQETRRRALAINRAIAEREAARFPQIARRYSELQRQLGIATRTLDQLQIQRETLRVEAAQNQVPWEIISPPLLPRDETGAAIPDPASSMKKMLLGVVAGVILGLGSALGLEKYQNIFHSEKDITDLVPAPLLGVIPRYDGAEPVTLGALDPEVALEANPSAVPFLEAFNKLYANLAFEFADEDVRAIAVCSAVEGDGKTTTALYLAQTAAAMGQRILLVDANFRSPQIHSRLNLPNQRGLGDLLHEKQLPDVTDPAIQPSGLVDSLFVLTAGNHPVGTTRLLASAKMKRLTAKLYDVFDLVIYDTPPLNGVLDANFVAAQTDGILLVAAVRQTPRTAVVQALKQLKDYKLPVLGAIANGVKQTKGTDWEDSDEEDYDDYDENYDEDEGEVAAPDQELADQELEEDLIAEEVLDDDETGLAWEEDDDERDNCSEASWESEDAANPRTHV